MLTWIIFNNHLFDIGLTQNPETMALQMLTTDDLFYIIICEDLHEKIIEIAFGWGTGHIWLHTSLEECSSFLVWLKNKPKELSLQEDWDRVYKG